MYMDDISYTSIQEAHTRYIYSSILAADECARVDMRTTRMYHDRQAGRMAYHHGKIARDLFIMLLSDEKEFGLYSLVG